jgi:tetratricopeptide (TPR) repeat protein
MVGLSMLAGLSARQAGWWRDDVTLWRHTIDVNPRSFLAHNNLGAALYRLHDLTGAERAFREAIRIKSDYATAHDNLAIVLINTAREEEAIDEIAQVLRVNHLMPVALRPRLDEAHNRFGLVLVQRGRHAEAAEHFRKALAVNPDHVEARRNLEAVQRQEPPVPP